VIAAPAVPRVRLSTPPGLFRIDKELADMKYRVWIEQDETGTFVAEVPSLPGCISQGRTRKDALANIREAIELYIESLREHGDPVPPPITEEIVEI
jgi:predicted RNase H-like HicB family nuclease